MPGLSPPRVVDLIPHRELPRPFASCVKSSPLISLPVLCDLVSQGVIGVRRAKQGLNAEQYCSDLQGRAPFVLEDVKANAAKPVDVGMVDLCQEADFGRCHGVIVGKEEFQLEASTLIRRLRRTGNDDIEIPKVIIVRSSTNSRSRLGKQPLGFLYNTRRKLGRHGKVILVQKDAEG